MTVLEELDDEAEEAGQYTVQQHQSIGTSAM